LRNRTLTCPEHAAREFPQDSRHDLLGGDERGENNFEEEDGEPGHGERLDQPVDRQRYEQTLRLPRYARDRAEIDAHHHRVDHRPDQDSDDEIDLRDFRCCDRLD
jgi:hypothetical protein